MLQYKSDMQRPRWSLIDLPQQSETSRGIGQIRRDHSQDINITEAQYFTVHYFDAHATE